jgi:hypothetical protein
VGLASVRITNADRRILLESVRTLATDWVGENADLIIWATGWVASLAPTFGFEMNLSRRVPPVRRAAKALR